jgi:hypothetical protein
LVVSTVVDGAVEAVVAGWVVGAAVVAGCVVAGAVVAACVVAGCVVGTVVGPHSLSM